MAVDLPDPDHLLICMSCLHELHRHGVTGCTAVDEDGNRCACEYVP